MKILNKLNIKHFSKYSLDREVEDHFKKMTLPEVVNIALMDDNPCLSCSCGGIEHCGESGVITEDNINLTPIDAKVYLSKYLDVLVSF